MGRWRSWAIARPRLGKLLGVAFLAWLAIAAASLVAGRSAQDKLERLLVALASAHRDRLVLKGGVQALAPAHAFVHAPA